MKRVYFTESDQPGWAIEEDLRLLRKSLAGIAEPASLSRAEVVHSVWWNMLIRIPPDMLKGRHVLCYADNSPFHYAAEPEFIIARERVTLWIARSSEAERQFEALGLKSTFAPYTVDETVFQPIARDSPDIRKLREQWNLPRERYLIANFHRDTEGGDLRSPKLQKGPDVFLEIVSRVHERRGNVHVVLAGPRRFWLREQLAARGVPFTFIGEKTDGDDAGVNILPRTLLNLLYNAIDLYLVCSRWEGGPHSILEAAATRCKILSSRVGIAPDVLNAQCIFDDPVQAIEMIERDQDTNFLEKFCAQHAATAQGAHSGVALRKRLSAIYESLEDMPAPKQLWCRPIDLARLAVSQFCQRFPAKLAISILHEGASREPLSLFLDTVARALEQRGVAVVKNQLDVTPSALLLGNFALPFEFAPRAPVIQLLAFESEEHLADELELNRRVASVTIVPSLDLLLRLRASASEPRRPIVIPPIDPSVARRFNGRIEIVASGERDVARRVFAALTTGTPVLYPRDCAWFNGVWFGGLPYSAAMDSQRNRILDNYQLFHQLAVTPPFPAIVELYVRLLVIARDIEC